MIEIFFELVNRNNLLVSGNRYQVITISYQVSGKNHQKTHMRKKVSGNKYPVTSIKFHMKRIRYMYHVTSIS